jgi:Synergist-CTERM protein sorting domain-containing protein
MRALVAAAVAIAALASARPARACSLLGYAPLVLDPAMADDHVAPTVAAGAVTVFRGTGSCSGYGGVEIQITATDDRTAPDLLAHTVTVRTGTLAIFGGATDEPFTQPSDSVTIYFTDTGQALDLELEVRAVDRNGNRSEPAVVTVVVPEADAGGCAVGGGAGWLAALALVPVLRRRRARR